MTTVTLNSSNHSNTGGVKAPEKSSTTKNTESVASKVFSLRVSSLASVVPRTSVTSTTQFEQLVKTYTKPTTTTPVQDTWNREGALGFYVDDEGNSVDSDDEGFDCTFDLSASK
ncbi:hypothetical protein COB21_02875 [Candidatus Aerophobetes bacterium]|uniref:Uncharacterized protein n=1 Tax=Aerophobetes bacterium TaxID=2030807 RepID=A0A2A4X682_UNCAE|nr:MAG: hypothetical protein COB21_02875 [Candidatus Aerophobetes bacterium]